MRTRLAAGVPLSDVSTCVGSGRGSFRAALGTPHCPYAPVVDVLDTVMPSCHFSSHHEVVVAAPPERTAAALMSLDTRDLVLTRLLMGVRGLPARLRGRHSARSERSRRGVMSPPFVELANNGHAAAFGLAGQFWKPVATPVALRDADEFAAFNRPGYAKAVIGFEIRPAPGGCVLATETRIAATDEAARRSFGRYWRIIRAGSGVIRYDMLRTVRRNAERR